MYDTNIEYSVDNVPSQPDIPPEVFGGGSSSQSHRIIRMNGSVSARMGILTVSILKGRS